MKIIFSLPLLIFLCMTTYTKVLIAEDFLLRDGDGNTVSFGKGTLGLRQKSGSQGNTSVQDLQGLQGLESLRSLGDSKQSADEVTLSLRLDVLLQYKQGRALIRENIDMDQTS